MSTDNSLVNFKAIVDFVNNLGEMFSKEQHSLKLYSHLLNKTTLSHELSGRVKPPTQMPSESSSDFT